MYDEFWFKRKEKENDTGILFQSKHSKINPHESVSRATTPETKFRLQWFDFPIQCKIQTKRIWFENTD